MGPEHTNGQRTREEGWKRRDRKRSGERERERDGTGTHSRPQQSLNNPKAPTQQDGGTGCRGTSNLAKLVLRILAASQLCGMAPSVSIL